jgi:hypothetical protein
MLVTGVGDIPSERSLTAIASVGNLVYLFGGSKYGEAYNDTFVFNTGLKKYICI